MTHGVVWTHAAFLHNLSLVALPGKRSKRNEEHVVLSAADNILSCQAIVLLRVDNHHIALTAVNGMSHTVDVHSLATAVLVA